MFTQHWNGTVLEVGSLDADTSSKHVVYIVRFSYAGANHSCPSADVHNRDMSPGILMCIVVPHSDVHQNAAPGCLTTQLRGCTSTQTPRELYTKMLCERFASLDYTGFVVVVSARAVSHHTHGVHLLTG